MFKKENVMKLFNKCKMNDFLIENLAIYIRDLIKIFLERPILLVKASIFYKTFNYFSHARQ